MAEDAIVSTSEEQRIVFFNRGAEKIFEYTAAEIHGQPLDTLLPPAHRTSHAQQVRAFGDSPVDSRTMGERRKIFGRRKDGSEFPAEASISKIRLNDAWVFTAILRDISERRSAEQKIQQSLDEKELLLKEVYHRVKNNLQVISSMLGLQSRTFGNDDLTRKILQDSQNRVHTMALVHERLYQSANLARIDTAEYVRELAAYLLKAYTPGIFRIELFTAIDDLPMNINVAVPFGLILNELLSNCFKYAFPDGRSGRISVELKSMREGLAQLTVRDDGVGLAEGLDLSRTRTLGWRLVRTLAEQIDATLTVTGTQGVQIEMTFPVQSPLTGQQ